MLKRAFVFIMLIALSGSLWGNDFRVQIISYPKEAILSTPVTILVEIKNESGKPITLAYGHDGFRVSLDVRRSDGKPLPQRSEPDFKWTDNFKRETVPAEWLEIRALDITPLPSESCQLVVRAVICSNGPYFSYSKAGEKKPFEAWTGQAKSEEANIQIVAPSGIDKEAYTFFRGSPISKPAELLSKYPTSTYAGYALVKRGDGSTLWYTAAMTLEQREVHWAVPQGASRQAQDAHRARVRQSYEEFVAMAERFLAAHPDFSQADLLHKELANSLFLLDRRDAALVHLNALAESMSPLSEEAKKALEILKTNEGGSPPAARASPPPAASLPKTEGLSAGERPPDGK